MRPAGFVLTISMLTAAAMPDRSAAQSGGYVPGGRDLFVLDLASVPLGQFPKGVTLLKGTAAVVDKGGVRMLRASDPTEFVVPLPEILPQDFTLEFDLVPKACCNPSDLAFEGTAMSSRGPASMQIEWHREYLIAAGGGQMIQLPMPDALKATTPSALTEIRVSNAGGTFTVYTNGQQLLSLPNRQFVHSRSLWISLGGQDNDKYAVYLARLRISAGGGAAAPVAGRPVAAQPGRVTPMAPSPGPSMPLAPSPSRGAQAAALTPSILTPGNCGLFMNLTATAVGNTGVRVSWAGMSSTCQRLAGSQGERLSYYTVLRWDTALGACPTTIEDYFASFTLPPSSWTMTSTVYPLCADLTTHTWGGVLDDTGLDPGQKYGYRLWAVFRPVCVPGSATCPGDRPYPPVEVSVTLPPVKVSRMKTTVVLGLTATVKKYSCPFYYECWYPVKYTWKPHQGAVSYILSIDQRDYYGSSVWSQSVDPIGASPAPFWDTSAKPGDVLRACLAVVTDPAQPPDPRKGECIETGLPWP